MLDIVPNDLIEKGLWLNDYLGVKEWAWSKENALKILHLAEQHRYIILGGDVLRIKEGIPEYTFDNWYINDIVQINDPVEFSTEYARNYINTYCNRNGNGFMYVLVCQKA